jgi:hypothetical protein
MSVEVTHFKSSQVSFLLLTSEQMASTQQRQQTLFPAIDLTSPQAFFTISASSYVFLSQLILGLHLLPGP